jgi:ABC-type glycerol-3-phosphate transport system substrate-binding protein
MPSVSQAAASPHSQWVVTLASADEATPTVDLAIRWPADHPSIQVAGVRFAGYPNPDSLRSLTASFKARAAGQVTLTAAWAPAVAAPTLTLSDLSAAATVAATASATVDDVAYPAASSIAGTYSHRVAAGRRYAITLFNPGPDSGRPSLSATIGLP